VVQVLPALDAGGVEQGTVELARYLVAHGHRSIVIAAGGRMAEQLRREGSEHIDWPIGRKRFSTLKYVPRLRRLLEEIRPDILHLRSRLPAWIAWLAWRRMDPATRPHLVTTVHGAYTPGRYSAIMMRGERVIAPSGMIRDYILEHYPDVDPQKIRVIHRGVSREKYPYGYRPDQAWLEAWYKQYPQTRDRLLLTLPGRLTRIKGQEHFIEIIAELKSRGMPVHGLLVGEASEAKKSYEAELRDMVRAMGLEADITFTGHRTDLKEIMAISHVVLSLTLVPESFGRTTLEALSLGRPVIGYGHGGVGEQLREIYPQGLVQVGDKDNVISMISSCAVCASLPKVDHDYTLQRMCQKTIDTYYELACAGDQIKVELS